MKIKMSKSQWEKIGRTAGWMKKAKSYNRYIDNFQAIHLIGNIDKYKMGGILNNIKWKESNNLEEKQEIMGTAQSLEHGTVIWLIENNFIDMLLEIKIFFDVDDIDIQKLKSINPSKYFTFREGEYIDSPV